MSCRTIAVLVLTTVGPACDPGAAGVALRAEVAETPAAVGPRRGRLLAGERVRRQPVWPGAQTLAALGERLPAPLRTDIARSPVPVLVPGDPTWLARATIYSPDGPDSFGYALSATHEGVNIHVQGSSIATLVPGVGQIRGNRRIRGGEGYLSSNDGIRSASWIEHGVAYSLDLECASSTGPACSEAALLAAVEGLAYVGGRGSVGGAL